MIVYRCDRCKKDVQPGTQKYNIYREYDQFPNIENGEELVHLCPDCTKAFDKFLEGEEVKSHVIPNETLIGPMGGFKDVNANTN